MQLDVCFLVDVTGSMASAISGVKDMITDLVSEIKREYGEVDFRMSFLGYRDYGESPEFERLDFTDSTARFKSFVSGVSATGGGDEAEDIFGGMTQTLSLSWKPTATKVLFLICDAPVHGREFHGGKAGDEHMDDSRWNPHRIFAQIKDKRKMQVYVYVINDRESMQIMLRKFKSIASDERLTLEKKVLSDVKQLLYTTMSSLKTAADAFKRRAAVLESSMRDVENHTERSKRTLDEALKSSTVSSKLLADLKNDVEAEEKKLVKLNDEAEALDSAATDLSAELKDLEASKGKVNAERAAGMQLSEVRKIKLRMFKKKLSLGVSCSEILMNIEKTKIDARDRELELDREREKVKKAEAAAEASAKTNTEAEDEFKTVLKKTEELLENADDDSKEDEEKVMKLLEEAMDLARGLKLAADTAKKHMGQLGIVQKRLFDAYESLDSSTQKIGNAFQEATTCLKLLKDM